MLDTVAFTTYRQLNPDIAAILDTDGCYNNPSSGWSISGNIQAEDNTSKPILRIKASHEKTEIRALGKDGFIKYVSVELPHLYHGFNGIQLKPAEIDASFRMLHEYLGSISSASTISSEFCRLDLFLNIPGNHVQVLAAHRNARHPLIHSNTQGWYNPGANGQMELNTARFKGNKLVIQIYDKAAKHRLKTWTSAIGGPTDFFRVEIQIKNKKHLKRLFAISEESNFGSVAYVESYRVFREILCQFDAKQCDLPDVGIIPLLALCENNGVSFPDGQSVIDWYRSTVKPETFRRTLKSVQRCQMRQRKFRWEDILPQDGPPETVDLMPTGELIRVPPPFWLPDAPKSDN